MRPSDVNLKNESVVWERLYGDEANKLFKYKFSVGDQVRISKARRKLKRVTYPVGSKKYSRSQSEYEENPLCIK